jgi:hypothetical protein
MSLAQLKSSVIDVAKEYEITEVELIAKLKRAAINSTYDYRMLAMLRDIEPEFTS